MAKLIAQSHQRNGHIPNLKQAENGRKWWINHNVIVRSTPHLYDSRI